MRKVRGIGINDTIVSGPSCTKRDVNGKKTNLMDYSLWCGILVRATNIMPSYPASYSDVTINEKWLLRSNFQKWLFSHTTYYDNSGRRLEIDKDLLVPGNREYGPEFCCLVPNYLNTIFNTGIESKSGLPMWVSYREKNKDMKNSLKNPFRASITKDNGLYKHLGYFPTADSAHRAAQLAKIAALEDTLEKYKVEGCYRQDVYDAILPRVSKIKQEYLEHKQTIVM